MNKQYKQDIREIFTGVRPTASQVEDAFLELDIIVRLYSNEAGKVVVNYLADSDSVGLTVKESLHHWLPLGMTVSLIPCYTLEKRQ